MLGRVQIHFFQVNLVNSIDMAGTDFPVNVLVVQGSSKYAGVVWKVLEAPQVL